MMRKTVQTALVLALAAVVATPAHADKIKNPTAIFAGLDKITGRIISFEVAINETVQFGALQLTTRVCYSRPPTEPANSTAFIEVDEITFANEYRRIFGGWVFANSPGLRSVEHAVYDVWLTDCKGGTEIIPETREPERLPEVATEPRQPRQQARPPATVRPAGAEAGRIDVLPQQGVPVQPQQAPSRRFFPTFPGGGAGTGGYDPAR